LFLARDRWHSNEKSFMHGVQDLFGKYRAMNPKYRPTANSRILDCIEKCLYCNLVCAKTLQMLARKPGAHIPGSLHSCLLECIEICRCTASFLRSNSAFSEAACTFCAEVCENCAWECGCLSGDDDIRAVRDASADCAVACREAASHADPASRAREAAEVARRMEAALLLGR